MSIRVLLVDDHPAIRAGLRSALNGVADIVVVAEAADGHEALHLIEKHQPDVLLLDCRLPGLDGVQVALEVQRQQLPVRVVALSAFQDDRYVYGMLEAGAVGYLLKAEPLATVLTAIQAVAHGDEWYSQSVMAQMTAWARGKMPMLPRTTGLTKREIDVLRLVARGMDNRGIADVLAISEHTVKFHVGNIYAKLNIRSRCEATLLALRYGLK